ncbi:MAG: ATP-dependent DNA helicase [Patescibacteria group bacterium]
MNKEQKLAVDQLDGPVMVIAGPGTGKTQILATRIANILLKTDTNPSSILALTFTESGASAMKKRLISLIGETAYSVHIQTFHGFCSEVIATHPEFFALSIDAQPLTDLDRYQFFEELIYSNSFEFIKPVNAPLLYLRASINDIQNLKREGVTPDQFSFILEQEARFLETEKAQIKKTELVKREKDLHKNQELLQLYIQYQQKLVENKRFDFEDMISLTVAAFQNQELLLLEYQEKLQYFLIDEYQDTNSAQNQVIQLLASYWAEQANVFVVGDPNQSIYRFQGASLENTFSFLTQYPEATVITLQQNYRSTQLILDTAKTLIEHQHIKSELPIKIAQQLVSQTDYNAPIILYEAPSNTLEHVFLAQKILELIQKGTPAEEIAVIYRNNSESRPVADILARFGIRYDIEGGSDVLKHPTITQLLTLFEVLEDIRTTVEDVNLFTLLNYRWLNLHALVILKSIRHANQKKIPLYTFLTDPKLLPEFSDQLSESEKNGSETLTEFIKKLAYWSGLDAQVNFPILFETVLNDSGFLSELLKKPNVVEELNIVNTLFSEIKRLALNDHQLNLEKFLLVIHTMLDHKLQLPETDLNIRENAVRLTTAHKSKGQEWSHVFITGFVDKRWGNSVIRNLIPLPEGILKYSAGEKEDRNEDERRLLYVALTRAKKQLFITLPQTVESTGSSRETTPSLFLQELPEQSISRDESFNDSQDIPQLLAKLLHPTVDHPESSLDEKEFITTILERFKLSATALNTYLECAYKFKLQTLLRVPRVKPIYMSFGTAIHKAMEFLFQSIKDNDGQIPQLKLVLSSFDQALQREAIDESEYAIRLAQGQKLLTQYYENYHDEFVTPLFTEKPFGVGFSTPVLDDIQLSGKIDKIEVLDAQRKTVKVVDYKTGRAQSRNEIEGKTRNSTGNYKRQLVFYKLLADLDRSFKMTVEQAEFDFVQPKDNASFVKHSFTISQLEVDELKKLVREVMVKIRNQEFPRTHDMSTCKECIFNFHCWPDGIPEKTT